MAYKNIKGVIYILRELKVTTAMMNILVNEFDYIKRTYNFDMYNSGTESEIREIINVRHKLRNVYYHMVMRCTNPYHPKYLNYGGRGIMVHTQWEHNWVDFYYWSIANGYKIGLTLDRIDNNSGYSPSNCRWVGTDIQALNKRTNRIITINGKSQPLKMWLDETKTKKTTYYSRLRSGLPPEKCFNAM